MNAKYFKDQWWSKSTFILYTMLKWTCVGRSFIAWHLKGYSKIWFCFFFAIRNNNNVQSKPHIHINTYACSELLSQKNKNDRLFNKQVSKLQFDATIFIPCKKHSKTQMATQLNDKFQRSGKGRRTMERTMERENDEKSHDTNV